MTLPLWFLILSLFLPRITLVVAYFAKDLPVFVTAGWVSPAMALLLPRALVLILIYHDRGMSPWLLIHGFVLLCVYSGTGRKSARGNRD